MYKVPTLAKPVYDITVPEPKTQVQRATVASILNRPKSSTEQALNGYDFLKSHSSRGSYRNFLPLEK
jgi:hypothetical protein